MAIEEALLTLASMAGRTVVSAAASDAWSLVKSGLARLLGHDDETRKERAEQRLEQTRRELAAIPPEELEQAQDRLAVAWQIRVLDLLEEHPELADELHSLLEQVAASGPSGSTVANGRSVAAGHDVQIIATRNAVAAGTIQGSLSTGNPPGPGPANS